ncbi:hypothetical protein DRH29_05955, partial [candidate division Kazan bacterium]
MIDGSDWVMERHKGTDDRPEPVLKRKLKYFTELHTSDWKTVETGLIKAFRSNFAFKPRLDITDDDIKKLCRWLNKQVENTRKKLEANEVQVTNRAYREETEEHKKLTQWCAENPEELGLSDVIPGQTVIGAPLSNLIPDAPDVVFKMRGRRWAVVEVETVFSWP